MADNAASSGELTQLRVLAHPLRLQMVSLLAGAPFSAAELARELDISQAAASYHLRQLHGAGVVTLLEVRPKRGGRERVYAYSPPAAAAECTGTDSEGYQLFAEAVATEIRRRRHLLLPSSPRVGVDAELWVEPSDWLEAVDAVRTASLRLHERAQRPRAAGTIRVSMSAAMFQMTVPGTVTDEPVADD
jgi:DNA-binding transcriptional ArsR family regulator